MPGGDGTGPLGQGSKTGRGLGNCTSTPGTKRTFFGFGGGLGRGRGRGMGRGFGLGRMWPWKNQNTADTAK